ncbi:MAG: hypothetical protein HY042_04245 [Spirochaetia bacterium]|nr:hypothetical protein [Spirochaetia bacterium]
MPTSAQATEELEVHYRAYRQIFQAVLKKKTADPARIESSLTELDSYARQNIQNPDDFIDHIPEFARRLGIDAASLGAFIGANFLKAMQIARQAAEAGGPASGSTVTGRPSSPAPVAGAAPGAAQPSGQKDKGLMKEIVETFGALVQAPDRFVPMDWGLVIPQSLGIFENVTISNPVPEVAAPVKEASPSPTAAAAPKPVVQVVRPSEPPIIKEILEKFGSVLDVHEKLVLRSYEEFGDEEEAPPVVVAEAAPTAQATAAAQAPKPTAAAGPRESSIIKEILNKFGSSLDVTHKLVPKQGGDDGNEIDYDEPDDAPGMQESSAQDTLRIPLEFSQYMDTVKSLQEFQKTGDQQGYRTWLSSLEPGPKAAVGLRNLEVKARKGADVYWPDEYQNLSGHLRVGADSIKMLHEDLRRFEQLQRILNKFTEAVRATDPDTVNAARLIWPQVRMLFNEPGDEGMLRSRTKIIMLQVMDPARKQKIMGILEPLLKEAAGYMT